MSTHRLRPILFLALSATLAVVAVSSNCDRKTAGGSIPLRLGWQPPWANQGQIVEVLKHTDVLTRNGVRLEYRAFTYGGPMTEAALAGELDILFVGDQPAITLISRDPSWRIVARMVNFRSAFLVPPGSPIKTLKDLTGKKVATAFGSTTHRDAVRILSEGGLEVGKDVQLVNLDQAEHAGVIARGGTNAWGDIAAIATYDPTIGVTVQGGQARVLKEWVSPGAVVAKDSIIRERPDDLKRFLQAYIQAFPIYAHDPGRFNALYSEDSRLPLPNEVYSSMAACEPNLSAPDAQSVNILLSAQQQENLQLNADTAVKIGIIKHAVKMSDYVDLLIAEEATKQVQAK